MNYKALLEGLLFVTGEEGLTVEQISSIMNIKIEDAKKTLYDLKQDYEDSTRGIKIDYLGNTYKLTTKPEHKEYYQQLLENNRNNNLSQPALEILAIIVYNEPITRVEVDRVRGVYSGQMIRKLVAKGLVQEVGRSDLPGRPILYQTTNEFLDYFGLASKEELPPLEVHLEGEEKEVDLFLSRYQDEG